MKNVLLTAVILTVLIFISVCEVCTAHETGTDNSTNTGTATAAIILPSDSDKDASKDIKKEKAEADKAAKAMGETIAIETKAVKEIVGKLVLKPEVANDWIEYAYIFDIGTKRNGNNKFAWYYAVIKFQEPMVSVAMDTQRMYFVEHPEKKTSEIQGQKISSEEKKVKSIPMNMCLKVHNNYIVDNETPDKPKTGIEGLRCLVRLKVSEDCRKTEVKECIEKTSSLVSGFNEVGIYFSTGTLEVSTQAEQNPMFTKKMLLEERASLKFDVKKLASVKVDKQDGDNNNDDDGNIGNTFDYDAEINAKGRVKGLHIKDMFLKSLHFWKKERDDYKYINVSKPFKDAFPGNNEISEELEEVLKDTNFDSRRSIVEAVNLMPKIKVENINISSSGRVGIATEQTLEKFDINVGYYINDYTYKLEGSEVKAFPEEISGFRVGYVSTPDSNNTDAIVGIDYEYYKDTEIEEIYGVGATPLKASLKIDYVNPIKRESGTVPNSHIKVVAMVGGAINFSESVSLSTKGEISYSTTDIDPDETKNHRWTHIVEVVLTKEISKEVSIFAKIMWGENGLTFDSTKDLMTGVDVSGYFKELLNRKKTTD